MMLTGDGIHVVVDHAARRISEFTSSLKAADAQFDELRAVTPTIEDLSLTLLQAGWGVQHERC